jgi:KDO2-lipid IV(A) lauroyltransferase
MAVLPIPKKGRLKFFLHPRHWHRWLGVGAMRAISLLPLPMLAWCGDSLGVVLYYIHPGRREIATINICKCFPELTPEAQKQMVKSNFRVFGQALLDMGIAWWASPQRLGRLVKISGREHYDRAIADGKNVILLVPHFVGLEIGVVRLSQERPMCAVFRHVDNEVLRLFMEKGRTRFGLTLIEYNKPLITLVKKVREGLPLYYLPDQDARKRSPAFAPFFGIPTATFTALGRLAKITAAVVIPCFCRQLPGGKGYEIAFEPPLAGFPTNDPVNDAERMNREIERAVRETPEQYFWLHKRFKTRPVGETSFYPKEKRR